MNAYEKMISGGLYNANDLQLVLMRRQARELLTKLNQSLQEITDGERLDLCSKLFGKIGAGFWLQPPFYCDYGKNIEAGHDVYFNFNCVVLDVAKVRIGSHVLFGPNVQIYTATHPINASERKQGLESGQEITINDNVWVDGGAIICPGVTIGENSVIAVGAVVTKDVVANVIVGGNPAKIIRSL
ncbi:MAG: sugar O-acetyltransferase [Candidatus Omnitrophica bacterium]|nr:sugar O-acetyltransferase [Candidatus Omnitrophota bacterium]